MNTDAWRNGELTQTVPRCSSDEATLRTTISDLMSSPGVRSVSYLEPSNQLLIRFDQAVTSAAAIRSSALSKGARPNHSAVDEAVKWGPTASKVLLRLASALVG